MNVLRWLALGLLLSIGCSTPTSTGGNVAERKVRVVTTTGMITDLVRNVGGDRVEVTGLMGPGVDPHLYKATPGDTARLMQADLIFYNGLHLEGKMAEVFEQMGRRVKTVAVADGLAANEIRPAPAGYEGTHDPHIWFDVRLWSKAAQRVQAALVELDPTHAALYEKQGEAYRKELQALHEEVLAQTQRIPPARRVLITAHDAFYYFGQAYGFEVRGLQGVSTATETSPEDIQSLARFIAERQIPAIFIESSVPPRTIEALRAAVQARGFAVRLGGELYSDALGDPGTPAGTYVGMVRHNTETLVKALGQ